MDCKLCEKFDQCSNLCVLTEETCYVKGECSKDNCDNYELGHGYIIDNSYSAKC